MFKSCEIAGDAAYHADQDFNAIFEAEQLLTIAGK
jgi:hypothetical protein